MMVAEATETCQWVVVYDRTYLIGVFWLVSYVGVNILQCPGMEYKKFKRFVF